MNGKTILQIAEEIGVSKQAVDKRIKREPLCTIIKQYIYTDGGTRFVQVDGVNLIKSVYSLKNSSASIPNVHDNQKSGHTDKPTTNSKNPIDSSQIPSTESDVHSNDVYRILEKTIDTLQKQLAVKDEQILSLTEINRNLSESISADRRNELAGTMIDGAKLIEDGKQKKQKSLFRRLFRGNDDG